jgi:hypothetical protein
MATARTSLFTMIGFTPHLSFEAAPAVRPPIIP